MSDILQAIANIIRCPIPDLLNHYKTQSNNRINAVGDALEEFVKDAFANTITETDLSQKYKKYSQIFSWTGNQNNPPDLMLKDGDAVEVKKIQSFTSQIALNSSYPKSQLRIDDPMITSGCRVAETWQEKDIIYVIGVCRKKKLDFLWMIYGDFYAADKEHYEQIKNKIITGINEVPNVELSPTKELGRVNKVDPLGITYFRIRGMWGMDNPSKVYDYLNLRLNQKANFQMVVLMRESKYLSFPSESRIALESLISSGLVIQTQFVKSPNNPAQMIPAKIITYTRLS